MIPEETSLQLGEFAIAISEDLGRHNGQIQYFKVEITSAEKPEHDYPQIGLLRVGSATGLLQNELQLRETLGEYSLIAPMLACATVTNIDELIPNGDRTEDVEDTNETSSTETMILVEDAPSSVDEEEDIEDRDNAEETESSPVENEDCEEPQTEPIEEEDGYLEEEFYDEKPIPGDEGDRLLILTPFPDSENTLSQWLQERHTPVETLKVMTQICQLFCYFYKYHWCIIELNPEFVQLGQPIRGFDLTSAYPEGETLAGGLTGNYCAPELAYQPTPDEKSSTYTIGALLYHAVYGYPLEHHLGQESNSCPVPHFSQLLALSLSPVIEERFPLEQLRNLLIETRSYLNSDRITWEVASESTVGLSPHRLQNEDSYGITHIDRGNSDRIMLAALADGMGGMAQGEVASRVAVKTALDGLRQTEETSQPRDEQWLNSLVEQANIRVCEAVRNGGTTLSLVLAESGQLAIAHVGDSRIYLIHNGEISQLSEDHSLVAVMVASGQISKAESATHPDRNVLTRSLGSTKTLARDYVQTKSNIELQNNDVILLCSDGVWDLISNEEFIDIFAEDKNLQAAVDNAIALVLKRGAPDNATLLALRCRISSFSFNLMQSEKS